MFDSLSPEEVQKMANEDFNSFLANLETLSETELISEEESLVQQINEYDARLRDVRYQLDSETTFRGETYDRVKVGQYISKFIDTNEVGWSYTLGMYDLTEMWDSPEIMEVTYGGLDATLQTLGQGKYRGRSEWLKVLVINEYLKTCHEEYIRDTVYMYHLSNMHNAIIDRLNKINGVENTENTQAEQA